MEKSLKEVLDYYDKLLASQPYLTSNVRPSSRAMLAITEFNGVQECSLVDVYHLPWLHFLPHLSMENEVTSRDNVAAWYQRMQQRSAWRKVLSEVAARGGTDIQ